MTVEIREIVKHNPVERQEDEMPDKMKSSGITSEIEFLKRIKLKAQILAANHTLGSGNGLPEDDLAAASFESAEDKRKKKFYAKLIDLYKLSTGEPTKLVRTVTPDKKLDAKMRLAYMYSVYGMKDLYELACDLARIEATQESNKEITNLSDSLFPKA
jgi:hypothetical protein